MRHRVHRSGQAIVEFAVVAGVLILLMLGMLVFGQLFGWMHMLNNAVRDASRIGAAECKTDAELIAIVRQRAGALPNANTSLTVTVQAYDASGNPLGANQRQQGGSITVTATYDAPIVPVPGVLNGSTRRLRAVATFRTERNCP